MNRYEVIIIGAGPSGLSLAINLKKLGINDILVIEKYKFPRYKCCAGYVTNKTLDEYKKLGLDIKNIDYSLIKDFGVFYKLSNKQNIVNKFLWTNKEINRIELDYEFYKLAKSLDINILEETNIIDIDTNNNFISLKDNKLYFNKLVFADGYNSLGNKYQKDNKKNIAMQVIVPSSRCDEVQIHFGITKKGYAWISSYNGLTNIGITDKFNRNVNYNDILKSFALNNNIDISIGKTKGAFTPIGIKKGIINNNLYYIGDAVGACDPFTLSGLRYGIKCGRLCALSIKENNNKLYIRYLNKLKIKFCFMRIIMFIFYLKPIQFIVFNIICKFFSKFITWGFNKFLTKK